MTKSHSFFSGQHWLFSIIRTLGYAPKFRGMCLGVAYMGIQTMLDDRMDKFDEVINELSEIDAVQLRSHIKKTVSSHPMCFFYRETNKIAALKLFLEGAQFYHKKQKKILSEMDPRNKLRSMNGENLSSVRLISGKYSTTRMEEFFQSFRETYMNSPLQLPIAFLLTANNHAISLSYNPDDQAWHFINASSLPSKIITTEKELAYHIKRAFKMHGDNGKIILKTRVFTRPLHYQMVNEIVTNWRNYFKFKISRHDAEPSSAQLGSP